MRLNGLGVSPGIGIGRALVVTRGTRNLRFRIPERARRRASSSGSTPRARSSREQIEHIKQRIAAAAGAEHAYLFDAQLLMLDDPMLVDRAAAIIRDRAAERGVGARSARSTRSRRCSTRRRSLSARAQGGRRRRRRPAVHEPARRRRPAGSLPRHRRAARARRRRAQPVADRAARLAAARRRSSPTRAAGRITPRSSRDRSTCRRSPGCATPAALIPPGALVAVDGSDRRRRCVDPSPESLAELDVASQQAARATSSRSTSTARLPSVTAGRHADPDRGQRRAAGGSARARGSAAPKASACTDRSSCSPARSATGARRGGAVRRLPAADRRDGAAAASPSARST